LVSRFLLTAITADPSRAALCDAAGVDRIGVDVERLGKHARQRSTPNARISDHELYHLNALRPAVRHAKLFARLNPLHEATVGEVERAIGAGVTVLMLPNFTRAQEVEAFIRLVDGRATTTLLLETAGAVEVLDDILAVDGIDEIMVGLNDLSLSYNLPGPFSALASDLMERIAARVHESGILFGFGGVARAADRTLPVPSDLVLAQHPRLRSSGAWLARSFFGPEPCAIDIAAEVAALRARIAFWQAQPARTLEQQRDEMRRVLNARHVQ
jgi:hypothetical protein